MLRANGWRFGRLEGGVGRGVLTGFEIGETGGLRATSGRPLSERARWTDRMVPVYGPGARSVGVSNFLTVRPQTERSLVGLSMVTLEG